MPSTPLISFLVAVGDEDAAAEATLRSCLAQSLQNIEVICVHTDASAAVVPDFASERRLRLITQPAGTPAAELRRAGLDAVTAPLVFAIEPGDEVLRESAERLQRLAEASGADLVGFGVTEHDDSGRSARVAAPSRAPLHGVDVVRCLAPRDTAIALEPWRVVFRAELLRQSYAAVPTPLVDDRAIVLLAYAAATSYASVDTAEYQRSTRLEAFDTPVEGFHRALERIGAFRSLESEFRARARFSVNPEPMLDAYQSGYLTVIAEALTRFTALSPEQRVQEHAWLRDPAYELDAVLAAVTLAPESLPTLVAYGERRELGRAGARSVLLTTNVLTTGGVSGVLLTQARVLLEAGYRVTIATHRAGSAENLVPEGATIVQLTGTSRKQRVAQWAQLCRRGEVDVVIDHRILYSRDWPAFALAARATGAATIGWIHNFAGRPTYNGNDLQTLLATHLGALAHLVVLSPLDVAFWKLRGIHHVSYLPNPPSPFLLNTGGPTTGRSAPVRRRAELVWWGRLEEHTKKVTQLVEVAAALQRLGVDFRLRIVGPDWADMNAERLHELAAQRGVANRVVATGPQHGADLLDVIDSSDVFVNTSIIEGYPLTLPEAQSRGLPIAMYDLPWLSLIHDNPGVITTPQQDPDALASAIADLLADPSRYEAMSRASIAAATHATSYDFAQLYEQLMQGDLPQEYSPAPSLEDGRRILELLVFFAEHSTPPPRATVGRISTGAPTRRRRRSRPRTLGERIERKLTPLGHRLVDTAPWLRPVAGNVKRVLLRRS
ncbi:glycosyltransferase [Microbacterium invictum]